MIIPTETADGPGAPSAPRTACFTIVSKNYRHFARTLVDSLARHHPGWDAFVLLADRVEGRFDPSREAYRLVEVEELGIPHALEMLFRYNILELNTAVKPWFFRRLFGQGFERVLYLDPDVFVYEPLREVEEAWREGALAVLTPHLTGRIRDARKPSERDVLLSGAYNLGFLALSRQADLDALLDYWCEKSRREFVSDVANGLFTDQRWMDLVPGMFRGVRILRHEGYNVAYWNLPHREVRRRGEGYAVNGVPLVFFHFSGLDPARPAAFSKHQDRYRLRDLGAAAELVERYCAVVAGNGMEESRIWPYAFGALHDGTPLPDELRRLYQRSEEFRTRAGNDPFALDAAALAESSDGRTPSVTWVMRALHLVRPDLQAAFPDPLGRDREAFARWFVESAEREQGLAPALVEPVRASLASPAAPAVAPVPVGAPLPAGAPPPAGGWDGEVLRGAARKAWLAWREGRLPLSPLRWLQLARSHRAELVEQRRRWAAAEPPAGGAGDIALGRFADLAGFHERSEAERAEGLAWMGSRAVVVLRGARPGSRLVLRGEHAASAHEQARGTASAVLRLEVDGVALAERTLDRDGPFEATCNLPDTVSGTPLLVLSCSRTFVPAQRGLGADHRELGLRIGRLEIDGHPLVDMAREGHPYRATREEAPPAGITIAGYLGDASGVAQWAFASAESCQAAGIPFELFDVRSKESPAPRHPFNLLHVNADQIPVVCAGLGPVLFRDRYTVAVWAWELEDFPDEYLSAFGHVQEVWTLSRFAQRAIADVSPLPVLCMSPAVSVPASPEASRTELGLPEGCFLFLVMYDMLSVQERKNPLGAIDAFRRAFPSPDGVGLVVKVNHSSASPGDFDEVRRAVAATPGALLIDATLARRRVYDLEAACDAYLSLHRSEGFGLNLAECMLLGKPVVATAWSGNTDFMDERNSCPVDYRLTTLERSFGPYRRGCRWAEPDLDHAAAHLRRLAADAGLCRRLGERARATIAEGYSPAAVGARYRRRLDRIGRLMPPAERCPPAERRTRP